VDKNGMECFVERYKYVDPTKGENYFILRNIKGDGYETGLYHKYNKTVVIPAVYDTLNYISDDRIAAGKNYKYRLINIKQEEIIPFEYDNLDYINDNFVKGGDFAMKEKKIFDAITDVRDERIEEAKDTKLKKKNTRLRKWMAVAACAALLIIGTLYFWEETKSPSSGPIMDVVYPKAYAFENDDTWRKVREGNPVDDNFIAAINNFSYRTGALVLTDEGKNINYSPLSLYYALSIAASGSKSETEAQLLALLGIDDTQELSDQCGNLYRLLYRDNEIGMSGIKDELEDKGYDKTSSEKLLKALEEINKKGTDCLGEYGVPKEVVTDVKKVLEESNTYAAGKYEVVFDFTLIRGMGYYTGSNILPLLAARFISAIAATYIFSRALKNDKIDVINISSHEK
jgi:hypothetical protein